MYYIDGYYATRDGEKVKGIIRKTVHTHKEINECRILLESSGLKNVAFGYYHLIPVDMNLFFADIFRKFETQINRKFNAFENKYKILNHERQRTGLQSDYKAL